MSEPVLTPDPVPVITGGDIGAGSPTSLNRNLAKSSALLAGTQVLTTPLSIVLNMVMTRKLGAESFGTIFLAANLAGLAFIFVDWGQSSAIAGAVARDKSLTARLLGTGLWLKVACTLLATCVLWAVGRALHYSHEVQIALALTCLQSGFVSLSSNFGAALRGRERLDSYTQLAFLAVLLNFLLVVPVLLLGGHLLGVLLAQGVSSAFMLGLYIWRCRHLGIELGTPDRKTVHELFHSGFGFLLLSVVLALQPAVDSVILSKLSPPEVIGWHSAARRFVGILIFPATTLSFAIYPTLTRLVRTDYSSFLRLTRTGLRAVLIFGVPASVGCVLYAPVAIQLLSGRGFAPAAPVLALLSPFVFLVYLSMVLGASIAALNSQLRYAVVQFASVLISAVGDPFLVPLFQRTHGNGSLGLAITSIVSEVLMVAGAIVIGPKGLIDRPLLLSAGRCLVAGGAMAGAGFAIASLPWPISMVLSMAVYIGVLALVGGLDREQIALFNDLIGSKLARFRSRAKASE